MEAFVTLNLASATFHNVHTLMVYQYLSLSTTIGGSFSLGKIFSQSVDAVLNNIGSAGVVVVAAVPVVLTVAMDSARFLFPLDRMAVHIV